MNDCKLQFRAVLIDILDHLNANERKKFSFLLADDIERRICDDPTIGGTLDIFQQLFDRGKISEENFTYLIKAFQKIKCEQAAKSLKELQRKNLLRNHSTHDPSETTLISECLKDMEEDKLPTKHLLNMPRELISPMMNTENNLSRSEFIDTENIKTSHQIRFTRPRLIRLCLVAVGIVFVILATIGTMIYFSSTVPDKSVAISSPTVFSSSASTSAMFPSETNDTRCQLPQGHSCTSTTPSNTKAEGLGVYYENPCYGIGCGFFHPYCRLCWIDPKAPGRMDRPQCPSCVSTILNKRS